jgi:hypothetical protein
MMPQTVDRPMLSLTSKGQLAALTARLSRVWDSLPERVQDDILAELAYVARRYDRAGASRRAPA